MTTVQDQELKRSDGDSDSFNRLKETAIDASLRFIQERFQGMETDPVLLAAATLTTHQSWRVGSEICTSFMENMTSRY